MIDGRPMTQAEFMRQFIEETREPFNDELFRRENNDIMDAVKKVIYSCERDKYFTLKVLNMREIMDYEEMYDKLRTHEEERRKKGKENPYDYIILKDSDIMLLEVTYLIRKNGVEKMKIDKKEVNVENPEQILEVLIALPRFVNKYYFRLSGNYYNATTQIVDGSTYNNATANKSKCDSVTLKTLFMSVRIFRMFKDVLELNSKQKIRPIIYTSIIFNNHVNAMLYIFAKYGFYATMEFFGLEYPIIQITDEQQTSPDYVCFKKHNLYISCPKWAMEEPIVESICMTIYDAITKDTSVEEIYDPRFWLKTLGASFRNASVDKGLSALDSLEYIYDDVTRESIRLDPEFKQNIYQVLRWMMFDFKALRMKDNVDVSIKKRRIGEAIAQAYAMKLTPGIHRITDMGRKVKMKNIVSAVYTNPMYVISTIINMSNFVSYVDMVNDNDAIQALKFTYKGISGLGEDGSAVQDIYRFVDTSVLGILDPDTSSASDPGMTGLICPLTDTYGNSFTDYRESNSWNTSTSAIRNNYIQQGQLQPAYHINAPTNFDDYNYIKDNLMREIINNDRIYCPIKDLDGIIDYSTNDVTPLKEVKPQVRSLFTIIDEPEEELPTPLIQESEEEI